MRLGGQASMKPLITAIILSLPLVAWADIGTGTFSDGGLRWARDHSPAVLRKLHVAKDQGNDSSPDVWAKFDGPCGYRVKIEATGIHTNSGGQPPKRSDTATDISRAVNRIFDAQLYDTHNWKWSDVRRFRMDRKLQWGVSIEAKVKSGGWKSAHHWDMYSFLIEDPNHQPVGGRHYYADEWARIKSAFDDAMRKEAYVHYAYFDDMEANDGSLTHMRIGKTGTWGQNGVWTHKVRLDACGAYKQQTYYWETRSDRVTDFDRVIHDAIDDKFRRHSACHGKGGWDATYVDMRADGRAHITHRCNGKRHDGHFARGERTLSANDTQFLLDKVQAVLD